jgi:prophage regulatory protein
MEIILDRRPAVERACGRKRSALYKDISAGLFPPPIRIGARAVAWARHELQAVAAARLAGQSDDEIRDLVRKLVGARRALGQGATA